MKRSHWYLFVFLVGILLIIIGGYALLETISESNQTTFWVRAIMMIFWIGFTASNFFLYKREIRKRNES